MPNSPAMPLRSCPCSHLQHACDLPFILHTTFFALDDIHCIHDSGARRTESPRLLPLFNNGSDLGEAALDAVTEPRGDPSVTYPLAHGEGGLLVRKFTLIQLYSTPRSA